jgi:uncharacterized membrane protein YfcA
MEVVGLVLLGLFAGTLAATLGVGGGIIFVPVLVSIFAFGQLEAQGTSLAIILPTAIIGTLTHARAGRVVWRVAYVTGGFGIMFALVGVQLAHSLDEEVLSKVFAVVLAVLAVRMTRRAWRLWSESGSIDGRGDATG